MNLLLTGASGFIGSHVARAAVGRGDRVRCLVRVGSDRSLLGGTDIEAAVGDLDDKDSLGRAAAGADAVVHCAATTSEGRPDFALSHRTNVLGTTNLVEACKENRVGRFVLLSTQSANPQNPSAYGRTKLEAERIVAASGLKFTILRPSTVYGPGARGLFAKMCDHVERLPVIPLVGNGRQRFRPIYVGDLVAAILACCESGKAVGRSYDLGGRDGVSFVEFLDGIAETLGKKRMTVPVPVPLCIVLARALALVLANPPLTVDNIRGLVQMSECDIAAARADLGFRPVGFKEGLALWRRAAARVDSGDVLAWQRESQ
jgi:NADH dehydrogenase